MYHNDAARESVSKPQNRPMGTPLAAPGLSSAHATHFGGGAKEPPNAWNSAAVSAKRLARAWMSAMAAC
jgi:hypothetical protein